MRSAGNEQSEAELKALIDNLDYDHNEMVNYTEFIAATMDVREVISKDEAKLFSIFNSFDIDNTGFVSRENMRVAFSKYGRAISEREIQNIMDKHDLDKND